MLSSPLHILTNSWWIKSSAAFVFSHWVCFAFHAKNVYFNTIKNGPGREKGEFHIWVLFSHAFGLNTCKIWFETNSSGFKEFYDTNHKWDSPGFTVSSPVVRWALICRCHFGQPFCPAVGFIKDASLTLPSTLKFSSNKVNLRCFRLNHAVKCLRGSLLIKICSAAENSLSLCRTLLWRAPND